jgi:hypothetical protein
MKPPSCGAFLAYRVTIELFRSWRSRIFVRAPLTEASASFSSSLSARRLETSDERPTGIARRRMAART